MMGSIYLKVTGIYYYLPQEKKIRLTICVYFNLLPQYCLLFVDQTMVGNILSLPSQTGIANVFLLLAFCLCVGDLNLKAHACTLGTY